MTETIDCPVCGKTHRRGLGGTAMARIFGLVPKTNALDVYHELTRPRPPDLEDDDENIHRIRGHDLEPVAATRYAIATERTVEEVDNPVYHEDYPAFVCHLDRRIAKDRKREKEKRGTGVLEIKNPMREKFGRVLDYGLFQSESIQNMTYGAVVGDAWGSIAWHNLEHPKGPLHYADLVYDPRMLRFLLEAGQRFWDEHVVARVPPDPSEWELLAREDAPKLEKVEGELLVLDDEVAEKLAADFVEARDLRTKANDLYDERAAEMLEWMHANELRRAEVPEVGKFSVVQSDGRDTFSRKSLELALPLDWDLVRARLLALGVDEDKVSDEMLGMLLDLSRFMKRGDPFEYVLPPRA